MNPEIWINDLEACQNFTQAMIIECRSMNCNLRRIGLQLKCQAAESCCSGSRSKSPGLISRQEELDDDEDDGVADLLQVGEDVEGCGQVLVVNQ